MAAFPGELQTPFGLLAPYCGAPPTPAELAGRWNLDPFLIVCLILLAALYAACVPTSGPRLPAWRRAAFHCGWILAALALISPLC
ncbi:MAG: hypothetical protein ACREEB_06965, partial [Caulobacteraceae bacterium]